MYVQVRLLRGFQELLWYKIPPEMIPTADKLLGRIVKVPFRTTSVSALIEHISHSVPSISCSIKNVLSLEKLPEDQQYREFINKLSSYYLISSLLLLRRLQQFLYQKDVTHALLIEQTEYTNLLVNLTDEQQKIVEVISNDIQQSQYHVYVLHGVTGSGKTEVYKKLILYALQLNKTALLLLPEVTLATQFSYLLKQQMPDCTIRNFHSATSVKEKRLLWQELQENKPILIIGVHLPIMLPIVNLGLIIVDEEHEIGYQEKKHPRINTKEAAIMRSQLYQIPIVLGSATPSITTLHNVETKGWKFFQLTKRFAGQFPDIEIISLLQDKPKRPFFWISTLLQDALKECLAKKEQAIIFLNRRGICFFVQCKRCSFVFYCHQCSVSLTLHQYNKLMCHYCGNIKLLPPQCPSCNADEKQLLKKGLGTQQVVYILQKLFPQARIARADIDVTIDKKKWHEIVTALHQQQIDIVVGTQTITKGYHFKHVTLVGVIWADLNLHFPFYNAAETTLQQLIQVAGRAGRATEKSRVIIQTMVEHSIFNYSNEINYLSFYKNEIEQRKQVSYPPFIRLVEIELKSENEEILQKESTQLTVFLSEEIEQKRLQIKILGPAKPPVHKLKNIHIRKIYLKSSSLSEIIHLYYLVDHKKYLSRIYFTPNPLN